MSLLVVAVTAFPDDIVFQEHFGIADTHEVGYRDAAAEPGGVEGIDLVSDDTDGVGTSGSKVDLRAVDAVDVGVEFAIQDLGRGLSVGRRADGCALVQHEIAVLDFRVAVEDVDHGVAVASGEVGEFDIVEGDVRLNHLDACAVGEVQLFHEAVGSVFESHAELLGLGAVEFHTVAGDVAVDRPVDGDQHAGGVDTGDLVVDEQHVIVRDGEVLVDGEHGSNVGDHAVSGGNEVGQCVGGAVAGAGPLGVCEGG